MYCLIEFVAFGQINLFPCWTFILGAIALVGPFLLVEALVARLETYYWQNRIDSRVQDVFVLPPEIAALPLEADESKTMRLVDWCPVQEGEPTPIVKAVRIIEQSRTKDVTYTVTVRTVEAMLIDIDRLFSQNGHNCYLPEVDFA